MTLQAHLVSTHQKQVSFFMIPVGYSSNKNYRCPFSGNKVPLFKPGRNKSIVLGGERRERKIALFALALSPQGVLEK